MSLRSRYLLLILFACSFLQSEAQRRSPVYAEIKGRVTDSPTKRPVPNALVQFCQNENVIVECISDSSGYFRSSALKPGSYLIKTEKENYAPSLIEGVNVKKKKSTIRDVLLTPLSSKRKGVRLIKHE